MDRLTHFDPDRQCFVTGEIAGNIDEKTFYGPAVEKLAIFENLHAELLARQCAIPQELETLRAQGKSKSYKFKELFAQKLMNETILSLFKSHGLK